MSADETVGQPDDIIPPAKSQAMLDAELEAEYVAWLPNDRVPSAERQAELETAYQRNVAAGKPPYQGVDIQSRGELRWVIATRGWWVEPISPADSETAKLAGVNLSGLMLPETDLAGADLSNSDMYAVVLSRSHLEGANLSGAILTEAQLTGAILDGANLVGTSLYIANLEGASLAACQMDITTRLQEAQFDSSTKLADAVWNNTPLTRIDWETVPALGDEAIARQSKDKAGKRKDGETRLDEYARAGRAYRQLAVALRSQGLTEDADRYGYRSQLMQRVVLRRQAFRQDKSHPIAPWYRARKLAAYVGSWILWALAGYGYRPGRSILAYLLIVGSFAVAYHSLGAPAAHPGYHFSWLEAAVVSLTAFHGRGFFAQQYTPGDPQSILAAGEAVVGLLVEITFIATFTQRFFAR